MLKNIFKKEQKEVVKYKDLLYIYANEKDKIISKALNEFKKKEIKVKSISISELRKKFNLSEPADALLEYLNTFNLIISFGGDNPNSKNHYSHLLERIQSAREDNLPDILVCSRYADPNYVPDNYDGYISFETIPTSPGHTSEKKQFNEDVKKAIERISLKIRDILKEK